ncbi:Bgt-4618 [Blumeria graminis f. sp. tritici]|uniref:Bgt-4618 n=2 Tax=Blumeria graminis f. sp. tritici TaxID=62690 RepID=A0A061HKK1_BLUGR|nr:hypothetical protein BGT96224_4618 [Blumeria graminis f. sp. tritici 96224]VCU40536.1 Bgt-4618 [Blumeria graminis f. sp. tritici]
MHSSNWRIKSDGSSSSSIRMDRDETRINETEEIGENNYGMRLDVTNSSLGYSDMTSPHREKLCQNGLRKPIQDAKAEQAIEEGRRLYVGNMPYEATPKDVERLFEKIASGIEAINMSVDPMTGRNPSYCFVDFVSKELAMQVMAEYNGRDFMRRELKVKPGVKSGTGTGKFHLRPTHILRDHPAATERWTRLENPEDQQDATKEGRRLYIGNLPRFQNYAVANRRIRELLQDYAVITVSKLISPTETNGDTSCYCFVDLATYADADRAIRDLNGASKFSSCPRPLKVNRASGISKKLGERRRLYFGGLPKFYDQFELELVVREIFEDFNVSSVSKLFTPREVNGARAGSNCHFCFVELETEEETTRAMSELDWKKMWGGRLRVKPSTSVKPDDNSIKRKSSMSRS